MIKIGIVSSILILGLVGCSSKMEDNRVIKSDGNYLHDEFIPNNIMTTEDEIFNLESSKNKIMNHYRLQDILVEGDREGVPRSLITKKIEYHDFKNNPKIGSVIDLFLSDVEGVNFMRGPNVDQNLPVNLKISNVNLYEALQRVAQSVGYFLYYDESQNSIILDAKQTRKYRIPSGILLEKDAKNDASGASIVLKPEIPYKVLEEGLKNAVGSVDKGLSIDKDSGLIIVKDHAQYIKEIDNYVLDFVQDRSRQFIIETAIVEVTHNDSENYNFDIKNLSTMVGSLPVTISSISGGGGLVGGMAITSSYSKRDISLDSVLQAINSNTVSKVVDRPRILLFNHSVGYVNRGSEKSYVSSVEKVYDNNNNVSYNPKQEKFDDGLKIAMRVDANPKKDLITLSLAPSIKTGRLEPVKGTESLGAEKLNLEVREIMTNAAVKDGDIIVLGGIKSSNETVSEDKNYFLKNVPILGDIFKQSTSSKIKIETLFLVKVKEIKQSNSSFSGVKVESLDSLKESD